MKRILLVSLLTSFSTNAQIREKGDFEITPYIGYGVSAFTGKTEDYVPKEYKKNNYLESIGFGFGMNLYLNNRFSIRSGLTHQMMGTEGFVYENPFNGRGSYVVQKLSYMSIPLHLNWHFGELRNWSLYGGATFGLSTRATSNEKDIKSYINEAQIGFGYGLAYKYVINDKIGIGLIQDNFIGLTYAPKNVVKGDGYGNRYDDQQKIKNIYGSINIQFTYLLK